MTPKEWIHDVGTGPFIGAMIFIVAITVGSVMFAKYCVGEKAFRRTGYDFEGYVMRKCPVCVGLPKRTHPRVIELAPREVEVVVEEERASEPPAPPPATPAPAPPPPAPTTPAPPRRAAATPAPPPPTTAATPTPRPPSATVAVPVPAAAKEDEEEDEVDEDMEEEEEEDFDFDEYDRKVALGLI